MLFNITSWCAGISMKNWAELAGTKTEKKKKATRYINKRGKTKREETLKIKHNKNGKVIFQKQCKQSIINADSEMILNARFQARELE